MGADVDGAGAIGRDEVTCTQITGSFEGDGLDFAPSHVGNLERLACGAAGFVCAHAINGECERIAGGASVAGGGPQEGNATPAALATICGVVYERATHAVARADVEVHVANKFLAEVGGVVDEVTQLLVAGVKANDRGFTAGAVEAVAVGGGLGG